MDDAVSGRYGDLSKFLPKYLENLGIHAFSPTNTCTVMQLIHMSIYICSEHM